MLGAPLARFGVSVLEVGRSGLGAERKGYIMETRSPVADTSGLRRRHIVPTRYHDVLRVGVCPCGRL